MKRNRKNERGSLSLEHVLFIAAIVVIGGVISQFFGAIGTFFTEATEFVGGHNGNPGTSTSSSGTSSSSGTGG
ncbi:hypothetical protein JNK13_08370 [bacterium]|nr:hypothetical protein [bacterium]